MSGHIPDRFELEGWHGQLSRVERWHRRASMALDRQAQGGDPEEAVDYLYAFFQAAYHLRDWLLKSGAAVQASLDTFMHETPALGFCRDVCNGSKHLVVDATHKTARVGLMREYVPAGTFSPSGGTRFRLLAFEARAGGVTYQDIDELRDEVVSAWRGFCGSLGAT